jgi:hypothetical protein
LNAGDGADGERRWLEAGRPVLPSLFLNGETMPVLHPSQIAKALGLPSPATGAPSSNGRDVATVLDAWRAHLLMIGWDQLTASTASRGRSLRNLTVNVFQPVGLLPVAWHTGTFDWRPDEDEVLERALADRDAVVRFAAAAADCWQSFLNAHGDRLDAHDPAVSTPRGTITFSALLSFQRWHAAYHYRQLVDSARVTDPLDLTPFRLALPDRIY